MVISNKTHKIENLILNDKPIDYFKVLPEYFKDSNSIEEITISPNEQGYISDQLTEIVTSRDINIPETITINAGVGQGKSTFAISIINYYLQNGFKVIIAAPFLALIDKYFSEASSELNIPREQVFLMPDLTPEDGSDKLKSYFEKQLFIATTHFFFRDGGEFEQANYKKRFNDEFINYCNLNNHKIVILFDEIHRGIEKFDRNVIHQFSNFKGVIRKQFFLSATYSLHTVFAIKFLSQATNKNNLIINSNRIKVPSKNSELSLFFIDTYYSEKVLHNFNYLRVAFVEEALKKKEKVNILVWSATLSNALSKYWSDMFGKYNIEPNVCNADTENKYDSLHRFNIGTLFTTGVNITEGLFIVILPPEFTLRRTRKYGVFTECSESIIQSVARMRANGKIIIVVSKPDRFLIDENDNYTKQLQKEVYFSSVNKLERFTNQNYQTNIFDREYNKLKRESNQHIDTSEFSYEFSGVNFPSYEEWVLDKGKKFINLFSSYGNKLVPYVLYCSFNNQFENCTLKNIYYYSSTIFLTKNNLLEELKEVYNTLFKTPFGNCIGTSILFDTESPSIEINNDYQAFKYLIQQLRKRKIIYNSKELKEINEKIYKLLLLLTLKFKKGIVLDDYTEKEYINHQIASSIICPADLVDDIVTCYKEFGRIKHEFQQMVSNNSMKIYSQPELNNGYDVFFSKNADMIKRIIIYLNRNDKFIQKKVFSFYRFKDESEVKVDRYSIIEKFRQLFLNIEYKDNRVEFEGTMTRYYNVVSFIDTPNSLNSILNLIYNNKERIEDYVELEALGLDKYDYSNDVTGTNFL